MRTLELDGARHALETISQLIDYEEEKNAFMIVHYADIYDRPAFPYRGILLDTARNFISVKSIKRTLDGMAASKLNTLHWHITDTHTFPLEIESLPLMTAYGTYSSKLVYSARNVRDIVEYGRVRGIRVMPEIDAPSHVGHGWQWGPSQGLGNLTVCLDQVRRLNLSFIHNNNILIPDMPYIYIYISSIFIS